jgi:hypothetical protein
MAVAGAMVMSGGVLLLLLAFTCAAYNDAGELPAISRRSFPKGFIFGTSSSSYQVRHPTSSFLQEIENNFIKLPPKVNSARTTVGTDCSFRRGNKSTNRMYK